MEDVKKQKSPLVLIKQFFGMSLLEAKAEKEKLTDLDCRQLGSAIARHEGLTQADVTFDLVDY